MEIAELEACGIDYQQGVARCVGDADFYKTLLSVFLQDDTFARAKAAFERGDRTELFKCLHELKGVTGNAAMTGLYQAVCPPLELLRTGAGTETEIAALFAAVETAYEKTRAGVQRFVGA